MAGLKTRMIGFVGCFFTARQAKIARSAQTRRPPGGEGRLKQIAAGRGIEIEHFSRDENAKRPPSSRNPMRLLSRLTVKSRPKNSRSSNHSAWEPGTAASVHGFFSRIKRVVTISRVVWSGKTPSPSMI